MDITSNGEEVEGLEHVFPTLPPEGQKTQPQLFGQEVLGGFTVGA